MPKKQIIFISLCTISTLNYTAYTHKPYALTINTDDDIPTPNQSRTIAPVFPILHDPAMLTQYPTPPNPIEEQKMFITDMLQKYEIEKLRLLQEENPLRLQVIMTHDRFGANNLLTLLKNFRNNRHPSSALPLKVKNDYLQFLTDHVSNKELETIQPNGQALVHEFSPWHWNSEIINYLQQRKVNLAVQTQTPDKFPGSTMAAIVICYVFRNQHYRRTTILDNAYPFLGFYFNNYPHTLTLTSQGKDKKTVPCWKLLSPTEQDLIYPHLTPETLLIINQNFQLQSHDSELEDID